MCEEAMGQAAFFKIIHPRFNTTQQLRLPTTFLKYIVEDESETAILKSPISKHCYEIKVGKTVDGVFLQDGLQKFLTDHSLGNYEFLVFSYQGNMTFAVKIFDMSGCEKQYKLKEPAKKRGRGRPPKKLDIPAVRRPGRPQKPNSFVCDTTDFNSDLPHFTVCMDKYSVRPWNIMKIPRDFASVHISKSKVVVVLRIQSGKSWNVNFHPGICAFCGGWPAFLHDNEIEKGDICVFELVGNLEFCVHFFPK
ncbi:hypothetical protein ACHQM5_004571 [Ranunculus cassubicifolius]